MLKRMRKLCVLLLLCAVPAVALEGRVRKPVAFIELGRTRVPTENVAAALASAHVPVQPDAVPREPSARLARARALVKAADSSGDLWLNAAAAEAQLDCLGDLPDDYTRADVERTRRLADVRALLDRGLTHPADPQATLWLHYLAGMAQLEAGASTEAVAHWRAALPLAQGRMAAELRYRIGMETLATDPARTFADWHDIDDPQVAVWTTFVEVSTLAGQAFRCPAAVAASIRLAQLPRVAELADAATLADATITACLADPLESATERDVPADFPHRAELLERARAMRDAHKWTASSAALELARRCLDVTEEPPTPLALSGTLQKLKVQALPDLHGKPSPLPANLVGCIVRQAKHVAIPGRVDARVVAPEPR